MSGELSRGKSQIQGDQRFFYSRILLNNGFQMNQFGAEDLQTFLDFLIWWWISFSMAGVLRTL